MTPELSATRLNVFRYWKCEGCWAIRGLTAQLITVRMASDSVLHYLYPLRMDDAIVPYCTSTCLHCTLRCILGTCSVAAISGGLVHRYASASGPPWYWRSSFRAWGSFLSLLFLQARGAGTADRSLHLCRTTRNFFC